MAYEMEEIRQSQRIFYFLLEHRELSEENDKDLYKIYIENEEVMNLVKSQGTIAGCMIERYGSAVYLIPREENYFLGYSKMQLRSIFCKSTATDKDYYLSQFVILTLLVEFYEGRGSSCKSRDYIRVGELMNMISERLRAGITANEERDGLAYQNMLEAFEALKSDDRGSRAKTTKEGFLHVIFSFLEKQGLIDYIEEDEMIKTTKKLDSFMEWNLLNKANYERIMNALGVNVDEPDKQTENH